MILCVLNIPSWASSRDSSRPSNTAAVPAGRLRVLLLKLVGGTRRVRLLSHACLRQRTEKHSLGSSCFSIMELTGRPTAEDACLPIIEDSPMASASARGAEPPCHGG